MTRGARTLREGGSCSVGPPFFFEGSRRQTCRPSRALHLSHLVSPSGEFLASTIGMNRSWRTPGTVVLAVSLLSLLIASEGAAQTSSTPQQGPATEAPKAQAPPLFPKHRRGIYVNNQNIEVIDATPQSPPLDVDDPSVPDEGEFEINLLTAADFSPDVRKMDVFRVDANYGIVLKSFGHEMPTQIKLEIPIAAARETGNPYQIGVGGGVFGLKFNFYNDENRGLSMSLYPQIEFATPGSAKKGLSEEGQSLVLPLLIAKQSKYLTFVVNAGLEKPIHGAGRDAMNELGFGVGRAMFRKLAVMADLHSESSLDFKNDREVSLNGGVIYGIRKAIYYARLGHTLTSDDGRHTFFSFGIKVLVDTNK